MAFSLGEEAKLLRELKVLGSPVAVEAVQSQKVSGRKKFLENVTAPKNREILF